VQNSAVKFTLIGTADYVRSTAEKTAFVNDPSLHKQLIYIPAWFGSGTFTAEWKNCYLTGVWQYTDLRFTTRDHTEFLPSYHLLNVALGNEQRFVLNNHNYLLNVFFRANNVLNAQYQSVAWRPMPGRNFSVGLSVTWIKQEQRKTNIITLD
jgi:iron complex outermembrane receptor protein